MKKMVFAFICIFLTTIGVAQNSENYSKNQLIIKFKPESNVKLKTCLVKQKFNHKELDALNRELNVQSIKLTGNRKKKDTYILTFNTEQDIKRLIERYQNTGLFEYVEPNFIGTAGGQEGVLKIIPNDPYFSRQYGLYNEGAFSLSYATYDADIDMDLGWDIERGDSSIIVAILDTGNKLDHPEFSGRIWTNRNESENGNDDDNNGFNDDIQGWDFANEDNDPTDDNGHGTNVTGILGANGANNIGYAGVDWNCKLMICKVLDQNGSGPYSWMIDAIYYAVDNGAKVINMSIGGTDFSSTLQTAINYAYNNGVTVVACMMNDGSNQSYYPAANQNTIAVGSTNANDERTSPFFWDSTSGSNYGSHIDVVAPGNFIYGLSHESNTNYDSYWGGTSQSTPLVAGLSALLLAQDPNRSPDDIKTIIINTAEDQVGNLSEDVLGFDNYYGYGRINAHQALLQQTASINKPNIDDLDFSIFPNPSSEYLFIQSNTDYNEVSIVNMLGVELFRKEVISNPDLLKIDISHLPKGLYIINISNTSKEIMSSNKVLIN